MYSEPKNQIISFLQKNPGAKAKDIVQYLHKNEAGVFRHLKKLQEQQMVYKIGKTPRVSYYVTMQVTENHSPDFQRATNWAISGKERQIEPQEYCPTRDVFHARSERLLRDLLKNKIAENRAYVLVGIVEEIGNNSFDHNLGQWRDVPGVFFHIDIPKHTIILADRGQGVYATLKRVKTNLKNHEDALRVAFTEMISGRTPERRGNGLKFVKKVTEEGNLHLDFYSGDALADIRQTLDIHPSPFYIPGTLAYLQF